MIQSGVIGAVKEVHVWCNRVGFPPGRTRPSDTPPVPKHINWDLWLGPAPERPYHPSYFGGCTAWEQWWDFGNGCLGDMGSHLIDLPFWALKLREPTAVEASGAYRSTETYPQWLTVRWEHPATAERPGLTLTWYDGGKYPPSPPGIDLTKWGIGVLFVGEKGQLVADYGRKVLLPAEKFKDFKPAKPTIPPSLGHYAGVAARMPDRRADALQLRLLRHARRAQPARHGRPPRGQEAHLGRGRDESRRLPRGRSVHSPAVPQGLDNLRSASSRKSLTARK